MRVCNRERLCIMVTAYILPDLRYIQRFSEVMTSCPHVCMYPPLYSSIECYECYERYVDAKFFYNAQAVTSMMFLFLVEYHEYSEVL